MSGYTVTNSIDTINAYCDNPSNYKKWQLKEALHDAKIHYENGNVSLQWYNYVVNRLSPYT